MIFVIWKDFDGTYIEPFIDIEKAEKRVCNIFKLIDKEPTSGVRCLEVINGERMDIQRVEVVSEVKLVDI